MIVNYAWFHYGFSSKLFLSFTCKSLFSYDAIVRNTKVLISYINESELIITTNLFILNANQTHLYGYWGLSKIIRIPKSVTIIKERAFENCDQTSIDFETSSQLSEIDNYAFRNCSNLNSFKYTPPSLSKVGVESFKDCIRLVSVSFVSTDLLVMNNAFENCISLVNFSNILSLSLIHI